MNRELLFYEERCLLGGFLPDREYSYEVKDYATNKKR